MTPNKKAPRLTKPRGPVDRDAFEQLLASKIEIQDRLDALKAKVLALECSNSRPGWSTSPSDVADSPCGWCLVCKLKEEVRRS